MAACPIGLWMENSSLMCDQCTYENFIKVANLSRELSLYLTGEFWWFAVLLEMVHRDNQLHASGHKLGRRIPVLDCVLHPLLQRMGGGGSVLERSYAMEQCSSSGWSADSNPKAIGTKWFLHSAGCPGTGSFYWYVVIYVKAVRFKPTSSCTPRTVVHGTGWSAWLS